MNQKQYDKECGIREEIRVSLADGMIAPDEAFDALCIRLTYSTTQAHALVQRWEEETAKKYRMGLYTKRPQGK